VSSRPALVDDPFSQAPLIAQQTEGQTIEGPNGQIPSETQSQSPVDVGGPLNVTPVLKAPLKPVVLKGGVEENQVTGKQKTTRPDAYIYGGRIRADVTPTKAVDMTPPTPLLEGNGHGAYLPQPDPNGKLYGVLPPPRGYVQPVIIAVHKRPAFFTQAPIVLTRATNGCVERPCWHQITGSVRFNRVNKSWSFVSEVLLPYSGKAVPYQTTVTLSPRPPK
jgi:hypothetical protein